MVGSNIGGAIVSFFFATILLIILVITGKILYLATLQKVLNRIRSTNRALSPGKVWLILIPFYGWGYSFYVYYNLPKSIDKKLADRGTIFSTDLLLPLGLAIPVLSFLAYFYQKWFFYAIAIRFLIFLIYWIYIIVILRKLPELANLHERNKGIPLFDGEADLLDQ